jgi:hypothetical protein
MHWHFNDSLPEPPACQWQLPLCILEEALTRIGQVSHWQLARQLDSDSEPVVHARQLDSDSEPVVQKFDSRSL